MGSGYSLWEDTPDMGSSWDMIGGYNAPSFNFGGDSGGGFDTSWLNSYINPQPQMPVYQPPMQAPAPAPQPQPQPVGQANPWLGAAFGALGPLAGLIGTLASGGQAPTSGPKPNAQQKTNIATGNQLAQQGASGMLPAQQMQMTLLQALQSGQGLPPGYAKLVEQAFEPQMGSLYQQAATAGRARGFHDAPATSPVGGAVLGPGLANIQGQMAAEKLKLMMGLPSLYNQPIATQGAFAQNYLQAAQDPRMMQQQGPSQPMGQQIGNIAGAGISGMAQGYNAAQQQNQNQELLDALRKANAVQGLSGTRY